jgi:hypothetical protein
MRWRTVLDAGVFSLYHLNTCQMTSASMDVAAENLKAIGRIGVLALTMQTGIFP